MIPLRDANPTRRLPIVTLVLIAASIAVFLYEVSLLADGGDAALAPFITTWGIVPAELVAAAERGAFASQEIATLITSQFLHGGWLHLGGNLLYLWIFGNNIEDRMGPAGYLVFYLLSGVAAAAAHIAVQPDSTIPVVGASGAVAGVMGAYLVLFPNVLIRTLFLFLLILIRDIKAKWLLGFWFVLQFFTNPNAGVAWVAHVGGFVFGALVALALRERLRPSRIEQAPSF